MQGIPHHIHNSLIFLIQSCPVESRLDRDRGTSISPPRALGRKAVLQHNATFWTLVAEMLQQGQWGNGTETRPALLRGPERGLTLSVASLAPGQGKLACTTASLTAAWMTRKGWCLSTVVVQEESQSTWSPKKGRSKGKVQSPEGEKALGENGWVSPHLPSVHRKVLKLRTELPAQVRGSFPMFSLPSFEHFSSSAV